MAVGTNIFALVILVGLSINYATSELLEWPEHCDCEGKYYCGKRPASYPEESKINSILNQANMYKSTFKPRDGMEDRLAINHIVDVANCRANQSLQTIYAIKDENDIVWYVPATSNFSVSVETYECQNPGRVTGNSLSDLSSEALSKREVYCMEQSVAYKFPVLSQDLSKLETELKSPKGGLPVSCSAKILKRN